MQTTFYRFVKFDQFDRWDLRKTSSNLKSKYDQVHNISDVFKIV